MNFIDRAVNEAGWKLAEQRELACRFLARSHLPRRLSRLAEHPRLLRVAYFLRPKWRPRVYVGTDLDVQVVTGQTPDGVTVILSETFRLGGPEDE